MSKLRKLTAAKARNGGGRLALPPVATERRQGRLSASLRLSLSRNNEWRRVEDQPSLIDPVPNLRVDPNTTSKVLVDAETAERKELEQLTVKELLTKADKDLLITTILAMRTLRKQFEIRAAMNLKETATIIRLLAECLKTLAIASVYAQMIPNPTSALDVGERQDHR